MHRTSLSAFALVVIVASWAPVAHALEVGTTHDADAVGGVDVALPVLPVPIDQTLDLGALVPDGRSAEGDATVETEAEASGSAQGVLGLSPEAQRVATAATAATGLAVLIGLAAHVAGIPLFSRITGPRVLDNEVRQRVHDTIVANPGITLKEIAGVCAIGWGTAVYHLKRLEAERLVVSERQRQYRRFYKNGGGIVNGAKGAFGELKSPVGQSLAQSILAAPGSCQKDLCAKVGISAPLASKYLGRLAEAGLVAPQREWKTVKYFPTPKLEELLATPAPVPIVTVAATSPVAVAA